MALRNNGTVVAWGNNGANQSRVPATATNIMAIAAGQWHSLALKKDGTVIAWGYNDSGQTTVPPSATEVVAIACGRSHNLALRGDGNIIAWGYNGLGQCTVPPNTSNTVAVAAGYLHSLALKTDGTVAAWGDNTEGQITVPSSVTNVTAIAGSRYNSLAIVSDGKPLITVPPANETAYEGAAVTLRVMAVAARPATYQWLFDGTELHGATDSSLTLASLRLSDAGSYAVVVSNALGFVTSTAAVVTVIGRPPTIQTEPSSQSAAVFADAAFQVTASGTAPLKYQWRFANVEMDGETNANLMLKAVLPSQSGGYAVVVSNAFGVVTSATAVLTVLWSAPSIAVQPTNQAASLTSNATFSVSASGIPPPTYQWRFEGTDLAGATNAVLFLARVAANEAGDYAVAVSNIFGAITSSVATLTVGFPPSITLQPESQTVLAGSNVTFTVAASGTEPLSYQWLFNGNSMAGAANTNLTLTNVQATDGGNYAVVVTNWAGSVTSQVAALTVLSPPFILTQPTNLTVAATSNASFQVVAGGTPPLTFHWYFGGADIPDGTNANLALSGVMPNQAGGYAVVVSNTYGVVTSSVAVLTVELVWARLFDDFEPDIDLTQWSVFGGTVVATNYGGSVSGANSLWFGGTGSRFATTIPVDVTAGGTISFWLRIAAGSSPTWEKADLPGDGIVLEYSVNGGTVWSNIGTYVTVAYTNWTLLQASIPAGAQSNSTSFRWRQLSNSGAVYDHWALDDVSVSSGPQPPVITVQPAGQTVAVGATATFSVAATGTAPLSYQWRKEGANLSGATNSAYAVSNVQTSNAGSFSVVVTNAFGSVTSSNVALTVSELPAIAAQPLSQAVFVGSNVTFSVTAYGAPPLVFQWYFKGTPVGLPESGTNLSSHTLANVGTDQAGNYSVVVVNGYGSVTSSNAVLTVNVFPPRIETQPSSQRIMVGSNVSFSIYVSGTAPFHYQWRFNGTNLLDATNSAYAIQAVVATNTGNYSVIVTNPAGSVTSSNALLMVVVPPTLALQFSAGYPLVKLAGMLSNNFVVQYNTNLAETNWIHLLSLTNLSVSPYQFLDPVGGGEPARFYRAFMQ